LPTPRLAASRPLPALAWPGYVVDPDGSKRLWVARRSRTKQTWPGKLDHIVAGGQVRGGFMFIALSRLFQTGLFQVFPDRIAGNRVGGGGARWPPIPRVAAAGAPADRPAAAMPPFQDPFQCSGTAAYTRWAVVGPAPVGRPPSSLHCASIAPPLCLHRPSLVPPLSPRPSATAPPPTGPPLSSLYPPPFHHPPAGSPLASAAAIM
jgi:hypothetical protein